MRSISFSLDVRNSQPFIDARLRFMCKVGPTDSGCWAWEGCKNKDGYGAFHIGLGVGSASAHRASYLLHRGDIPSGYVVDHMCGVRHCVNPDHLRLLTQLENLQASGNRVGIAFRRNGLCACGGSRDYENKKTGQRFCRSCKAAYLRKWRTKKKLQ